MINELMDPLISSHGALDGRKGSVMLGRDSISILLLLMLLSSRLTDRLHSERAEL